MLPILNSLSRSISAPEAMRPEVGTPRVTELPDAPEAETAPVSTVPWATA